MKRCGECGSTNIKLENIKGTSHPWKDFKKVVLAYDLEVPVCQNCGNQLMSTLDLIELDKNIAASILVKVQEAIHYLKTEKGVAQADLASALGCSPEYLSMLKSGAKRPSFTVFNLLMCYRKNPQQLEELADVQITKSKVTEVKVPTPKDILRRNRWSVNEGVHKDKRTVLMTYEVREFRLHLGHASLMKNRKMLYKGRKSRHE